jgi:hypothetical protein
LESHKDRAIHIRLEKLREGGLELSPEAKLDWEQILARHPGWPKTTTEKDEFVIWFDETQFSVSPDSNTGRNDYPEWANDRVIHDLVENPLNPQTLERWQGS